MKLLLDTHIILWSASSPDKLLPAVAAALKDRSNELWFSPVSVWEILLLAEKFKIKLKKEAVESIHDMIRSLSLKEAALNLEVAIQSRKINLPHQDPADRFLAATSLVYGYILVTSDERLIECDELSVLANK